MLACHGSSGPPYGHTSERKRSGKQDGGRSLARCSESSSDAAKLVAVAYYAGDDHGRDGRLPCSLVFFLSAESQCWPSPARGMRCWVGGLGLLCRVSSVRTLAYRHSARKYDPRLHFSQNITAPRSTCCRTLGAGAGAHSPNSPGDDTSPASRPVEPPLSIHRRLVTASVPRSHKPADQAPSLPPRMARPRTVRRRRLWACAAARRGTGELTAASAAASLAWARRKDRCSRVT